MKLAKLLALVFVLGGLFASGLSAFVNWNYVGPSSPAPNIKVTTNPNVVFKIDLTDDYIYSYMYQMWFDVQGNLPQASVSNWQLWWDYNANGVPDAGDSANPWGTNAAIYTNSQPYFYPSWFP